jgi:hypothetical protein
LNPSADDFILHFPPPTTKWCNRCRGRLDASRRNKRRPHCSWQCSRRPTFILHGLHIDKHIQYMDCTTGLVIDLSVQFSRVRHASLTHSPIDLCLIPAACGVPQQKHRQMGEHLYPFRQIKAAFTSRSVWPRRSVPRKARQQCCVCPARSGVASAVGAVQ